MYEDLEVPFFADHSTALSKDFDSKTPKSGSLEGTCAE
jgi:hypothetical protein